MSKGKTFNHHHSYHYIVCDIYGLEPEWLLGRDLLGFWSAQLSGRYRKTYGIGMNSTDYTGYHQAGNFTIKATFVKKIKKSKEFVYI